MKTTFSSVIAIVTTLASTGLATAGTYTERKGGIKVTIEADGKKDNGGDLVHAFKLTGDSSNRKDDKLVEGTIHLLDEDGEALSDCPFETTVFAAQKKTIEVLCFEQRDWAQFTVDLTVGPARD